MAFLLSRPEKPAIRAGTAAAAEPLRAQLAAFLPQLQRANAELAAASGAGAAGGGFELVEVASGSEGEAEEAEEAEEGSSEGEGRRGGGAAGPAVVEMSLGLGVFEAREAPEGGTGEGPDPIQRALGGGGGPPKGKRKIELLD